MTTANETDSALDPGMLEALREGVAGVLAERCDSTALHAFIDGKNSLTADLWAQAAALGWFGFGIAERHGGLGLGCQGLSILHRELGRAAAPGPYVATLSAAQVIADCGDDALRAAWLPRLAAGAVSVAVPVAVAASPLTRSAGVSGTLRCLGAPDAAILLAPAGNAWVVADLAGARVTRAPMWDMTRDVIDVTLSDAPIVGVLADARAARQTLTRAMALALAADCAGGARSVT
ncbi:MAG: acyl-CoA dehydrogenase family protein, partial [Acetobacteraceae bacterium]